MSDAAPPTQKENSGQQSLQIARIVSVFCHHIQTHYSGFRDRLQASVQHFDTFLGGASEALLEEARSAMPIDELHEKASKRMDQDPTLDFNTTLLKCLMTWYKNDYFSWVNAPPCTNCSFDAAPPTPIGPLSPTPSEQLALARNVEGYRCQGCQSTIRFPRYNSPAQLMKTRAGRCGEWANLFCLFCLALGFECRHVIDYTDHVWVEVWDDRARRWIPMDACEGEGAFDTPLMYESGWGKKLNFIFAFDRYGVTDVTRRYTQKWTEEVLPRRRAFGVPEYVVRYLCHELTAAKRIGLSVEFVQELRDRDAQEALTIAPGSVVDGQLPVRQSGSLDWRLARGELGFPSL